MNKKTKSIIAVLMMLMIALGLAACGSEPASTTAKEPAKAEEKAEEPASAEEESEESEDAEETEEEVSEESAEEETGVGQADADESYEVVESEYVYYEFRNDKLLDQHYEKHGIEMGFDSAEEYAEAACAVINNPDALSKVEKEDGDYVYYVEDTNEFVILSQDGYIRTYFLPSAGISYYNRQ